MNFLAKSKWLLFKNPINISFLKVIKKGRPLLAAPFLIKGNQGITEIIPEFSQDMLRSKRTLNDDSKFNYDSKFTASSRRWFFYLNHLFPLEINWMSVFPVSDSFRIISNHQYLQKRMLVIKRLRSYSSCPMSQKSLKLYLFFWVYAQNK